MTTRACLGIGLRLLVGRSGDKRDLARRSLRGAVIGIAVSLIPIVVVLVVADGMIQGITARYIELGSYHKQALPRFVDDFADAEALAETARGVPGVTGAWAEVQSFGVAFAGGASSGVAIRAVDPAFLSDPGTKRYLETLSGSVEDFDSYGAAVGKELAKKLGLEPGDTINLITLRSGGSSDPKPRVSVYVVRAIVSSGYRELDANWLFIHPKAAARVLTPETSRALVGIKIEDPYAKEHEREASTGKPSRITARLERALGDDAAVYDWRELERGLVDSLRSTRAILLFIMNLVVVVAAANVGGALVTLVMERAPEMAIMKSFGMGGGDVALVFLTVGTVVGLAGAAAGMTVAAAVAVHINEAIRLLETAFGFVAGLPSIFSGGGAGNGGLRLLNPDYYLSTIPIVLDYGTVASIAGGTVLMSLLASVVPALKAAGLKPLEILRKR